MRHGYDALASQREGAPLQVASRGVRGSAAYRTLAVAAFAARALLDASAPLTLGLIALGIIAGLLPLVEVRATTVLLDTLRHTAALRLALPALGLLGGALVATDVINQVTPLWAALLRERVDGTLARRIYARAVELPLARFEDPTFHDHVEHARRAVAGADLVDALGVARQMSTGAIGAVAIAVLFAGVQPLLGLLLAAGAIPLALQRTAAMQAFVRTNLLQTAERRRAAYWRDLSTKREPAAELRVFDLGPYFLARWRDVQTRWMVDMAHTRTSQAGRSVALEAGAAVLDAAVAIVLVVAAVHGALSAGSLVALLVALQRFAGFRSGFGWQGERLARLLEELRHLPPFLCLQPEATPSEPVPLEPLREGIDLQGVSFTYPGSTAPALRDITLRLRPGERVALVGENGSGKSTLAKLLLGLYPPTAGRILVDGTDLSAIAPDGWRARVSAVLQEFVRYHFTAGENIAMGHPGRGADRATVEAAARESGAGEVIAALPQGMDTLLGAGFEAGRDLSVGQWQKIALARAYLRDAVLVVLDEPAAALDAMAEREVYRRFAQTTQGRTMVLISHRLGSCRLADRIVVLDSGRIAEEGTHEELLARGGLYAEMYRTQAAWYREEGHTLAQA